MGCDGGTIPRRSELVKTKQTPERRDKNAHIIFQWQYCNISQQLLQRPIVACGMGKLYNKLALIESIIKRTQHYHKPAHVKCLKDVKELNLTPNPTFNGNVLETSQFICPLSGLEMSGKFKFLILWSCGCVYSERGLKEVMVDKKCPKCGIACPDDDVVVLNPEENDTELARKRLITRRKARRVNGF